MFGMLFFLFTGSAFIYLFIRVVIFRDVYVSDGATECGAITSNGVPIAAKGVSVKLVPLGGTIEDAIASLGGKGEVWVSSRNTTQGAFDDCVMSLRYVSVCAALDGVHASYLN